MGKWELRCRGGRIWSSGVRKREAHLTEAWTLVPSVPAILQRAGVTPQGQLEMDSNLEKPVIATQVWIPAEERYLGTF